MPINKTYLPEKGTPEAIEFEAIYPTASSFQLDELAKKYGYRTRHNLIDAAWRRLGLKRESSIPLELVKPNVPLTLHITDGMKTVAIINDPHNPYQDSKCLSLVETFLGEAQPDFLIYNGDVNDFYQISSFDKDPGRINRLQEDVNNTKAMFRRHKIILPNAKKILLAGNHEDRWQRFLWTSAPELSSLTCLTIEELFALKEYDIEYIPYECGLMINDVFLVIHGDIASVHSGYTAKRLYEKHGGCGICGHCHRGGSFYKRNRFGTYGWWENYCLCSLNPDWIKNPNWCQGFSLVHFRGKRFWVEQIPIIDHKFIYGGKVYE